MGYGPKSAGVSPYSRPTACGEESMRMMILQSKFQKNTIEEFKNNQKVLVVQIFLKTERLSHVTYTGRLSIESTCCRNQALVQVVMTANIVMTPITISQSLVACPLLS